jgi:hypothetical protein
VDSPFDFNRKMLAQKQRIQTKYALTAAEQIAVQPVVVNLVSGGQYSKTLLAQWNVTKAPLNYWNNYVFAGNNSPYPYIPGLGFLRHSPKNLLNQEVNLELAVDATLPAPYNTGMSAGVDCTAFVIRAKGYRGNKYYGNTPTPDSAEKGSAISLQEEYLGNSRLAYASDADTRYQIVSREDYDDAAESDDKLKSFTALCSLLVPGDLFYYVGDHVGIINDVRMPKGIPENIAMGLETIESIYYYRSAFVQKRTIRALSFSRNSDDFSEQNRTWMIGRMK